MYGDWDLPNKIDVPKQSPGPAIPPHLRHVAELDRARTLETTQ
ncbi:hypothetical protein ACH40D_44010 [Streptomyces olivaceoviridis]|uniref:Uncharacterized protein n=1 Tax=Streptomyces olivaceoviridis TaxID=1921 RepID=A0ABW7VLQ8_STROI|nr:hypothetical protein [Streptomyces corchorusii]